MRMTLLQTLNRRLHIFDDENIKDYEEKKLADRFAFDHTVKHYHYHKSILC